MNKQEIFDTVYKALLEQGEPSVNNGVCAYRGANGNKCAVGHMISDDLYDPEFEGFGLELIPEHIINHIVGSVDEYEYVERTSLLHKLQKAHDKQMRLYGLDEWKKRMKEIANEFNLVFPE